MKNHGFTFVETVITATIISILAIIASFSYIHHVKKSRWIEGKTALLELAGQMEQYHLLHNTYVGATPPVLHILTITPNGYYELGVNQATGNGYEIFAEPLFEDKVCDKFILKSSGEKESTGSGRVGECW